MLFKGTYTQQQREIEASHTVFSTHNFDQIRDLTADVFFSFSFL